MFCSNCGKELGDNSKFCSSCGQSVLQVKPTDNTISFESTVSPKTAHKKRIVSVSVITFVLLILFILLHSCLNSTERLEDKLTEYTWYHEYTDSYGSYALEVLEFHQNGKRVSKEYHYYMGDWISHGNADNLSNSWEIMDDKELYFKGQYYEWKTEWNLSGSKLTIGGDVYTNKPESNYPD